MQRVESDREAFDQLDQLVREYEGALLQLCESWGEEGMLAALLGRYRRQFDLEAPWPTSVVVEG